MCEQLKRSAVRSKGEEERFQGDERKKDDAARPQVKFRRFCAGDQADPRPPAVSTARLSSCDAEGAEGRQARAGKKLVCTNLSPSFRSPANSWVRGVRSRIWSRKETTVSSRRSSTSTRRRATRFSTYAVWWIRPTSALPEGRGLRRSAGHDRRRLAPSANDLARGNARGPTATAMPRTSSAG